MNSFADLLDARADARSDGVAYTYWDVADDNPQRIYTWGSLREQARSIAAMLERRGMRQRPVLLCFPAGMEYVAALFGCFYADAIAVPVPFPAGAAGRMRLLSVASDSGAPLVLTTRGAAARIDALLRGVGGLAIATVDDCAAGDRPSAPPSGDGVAMIQYTSGSTSHPKGVVLGQAALLANSAAIGRQFGLGPESPAVSWLPWFHDMGLVGGVLQPAYSGYEVLLMAPATFLRRPVRWLQAVSRFGATTSGGPNFAYDLCAERVRDSELDGVDLRHWKIAFNGAEPVRSETLDRFSRRFGARGFQRSAFTPCYGLAEATLFVTGNHKPDGPTVINVDAERLMRREVCIAYNGAPVRRLVSNGAPPPDNAVCIVDPGDPRPLGELEIGEVWVAGPSIGRGYWTNGEELRGRFGVRLAGSDVPFLRTGDLGFLHEGELFITGRLRDLIIIRGRNHHPEDIEETVAGVSPDLPPNSAAVFSVERDGVEQLVVLQETPARSGGRDTEAEARFARIRRAVGERHGIDPLDILLVPAGSIPRTSSGKVRRFLCRDQYTRGELQPVATWRTLRSPQQETAPPPAAAPMVEVLERSRGEDAAGTEGIAIVGASCRFPGAASLRDFWDILRDGRDPIVEVPPERWELSAYYDPQPLPGKMTTRWGGFLNEVDAFDPHFFGISPREAAMMDPQQRLVLEVAWEALDSAGIAPPALAGTAAGVFLGIGGMDYLQAQLLSDQWDTIDAYSGTGNAHSIAANRLSHAFDLRGPSVAIDTACSSSLVAIHLACESLLRGETAVALAGGVNLILAPSASIAFSQARMLAPDGRCKSFDAAANGYVRSEGCGVVVLRRLEDALAAGDPILGVIRGTAVNQDGRTSGIAAPNAAAQTAVIREARRRARITPEEVGYIEAHGTGTTVGDVAELTALAGVCGEARNGADCLVGSVKSNIGHTETAAGIAGLLKVLGCFEKEEIPAQLHLTTVNPAVNLSATRLRIVRERTAWPRTATKRIAGVSSFGFGGTNAHLVVEEPPAGVRAPAPRPMFVLPISARSENARADLARRYAALLGSSNAPALGNVCRAASRRAAFEHRLAIVGSRPDELAGVLDDFVTGTPAARALHGRAPADRPTVAFLFTGQGSQYAGMARGLYHAEPVFRAAIDACAEVLRPHLACPLVDLLENNAGAPLHETGLAQPALFAIEYALAQLWISLGIRPDVVCGHSLGEYVAACVAGVFRMEDALALVARRAALMQALPRDGAMTAISAGEEVVRRSMVPFEGMSIAAVNGDEQVVVSGRAESVEAFIAEMTASGIASTRLAVSHAFHSPLMEPMLSAFRDEAGRVAYRPPTVPLISNVTGKAHPAGFVPDAEYWTRHVREPVRFRDALASLTGTDVFIEIGPLPALTALARQVIPSATFIASLTKTRAGSDTMAEGIARVWAAGVHVNWRALHGSGDHAAVALPPYPFERQRFWFSDAEEGGPRGARGVSGRRLSAPGVDSACIDLSSPEFEYVRGHEIDGRVLVPASLYIDAALSVMPGDRPVRRLEEVRFVRARELPASGTAPLWITSIRTTDGGTLVQIQAPGGQDGKPFLHASAMHPRITAGDHPPAPADLEAIRRRCAAEQSGAELYGSLAARGLTYSGAFVGVERAWRRDGEALGRIRCLAACEQGEGVALHPALLDSAFHVIAAAVPESGRTAAFVPVAADSVTLFGPPPRAMWSHVRLADELSLGGAIRADVRLLDAAGAVLAEVRGLQLQPIARRETARAAARNLYVVRWLEQPRPASGERERIWLLLRDGGELAEAAAEALTMQKSTVRVVLEEDPGPDSLRAGITDVVCFATAPAAPTDPESCLRLLRVVQRLLSLPKEAVPRLWIVTAGASATGERIAEDRLSGSMAHGLGRTIAREHPELRATLVDVDADLHSELPAQLAAELLAAAREGEVALRRGRRLVPRLEQLDLPPLERDEQPERHVPGDRRVARLQADGRGMIDGLRVAPAELPLPGRGMVEIEVAAAGLNFRDVMKTLGVYPAHPGIPLWLGDECAGRVVAVGEGVSGIAPGDEVMAVAPASFSTRVVTLAALTVRKPPSITPAEAAAVPVAFTTAWHALVEVARITAGEQVLIHAGAGGVGLAAVQIAHLHGCVVHATAGTEEKRLYLQSLGVASVMDSRTVDFADVVLERTGGRGVDVVLNSLSGAAIEAGLAALRAGGRFVEIGRRDIFTNTHIGLRPFQRNVSFHAVDMERWMADHAEQAQTLLARLAAAFAAKELQPLPARVFPLSSAAEAFHFMAQRRNIGKVVLDVATHGRAAAPPEERREGTHLITGGLGALGLAVARRLAQRGASHLTLVSRRPPTDAQRKAIASIEQFGATVETAMADVADMADLQAIVERAKARGLGLRMVVHAAGVLHDALLTHADEESLREVLRPKVLGAWNLHRLTAGRTACRLVLFSSFASVAGSPGQGSYTAANAFLDALAHSRQGADLPATAIAWGPWAGEGMAARSSHAALLSAAGIHAFAVDAALDAFDRALDSALPHVVAVDADWNRMAGARADTILPAVFRDLLPHRHPDGAAAMPRIAYTPERLRALLVSEFARINGTNAATIDPSQPLMQYGFDSLMGLELMHAVEEKLSVVLPVDELSEDVTIDGLAAFLLTTAAGRESEAAPQREETAAVDAPPSAPAEASVDGGAAYEEFVRPRLGAVLHASGLDVAYTRASGDRMAGRLRGREIEVLDVVGGYGSTLFGHNHPELVAAARAALANARPSHSQGSDRVAAGELARSLSRIAEAEIGRRYVSVFANSGAEAVEHALKHALLRFAKRRTALLNESRRSLRRAKPQAPLLAAIEEHNARIAAAAPLVVAMEGCFHGKTLGALQLTGNARLSELLGHSGALRTHWLRRGDVAEPAELFARETVPVQSVSPEGRLEVTLQSMVAAVFLEPIQGEGGVHVLDAEQLAAIRALADANDVPLIVDEIQSGMGRTGTFFAATGLGLRGDCYCVGKSLGGGLAKVATLLIDVSQYDPDLEFLTTSTFAEDDYSALVALETLKLFERDEIASRCSQLGASLFERLTDLRHRYSDVIADVRGKGLMAGVEFHAHSSSPLLRLIFDQQLFGIVAAGFCLHEHKLRIGATLSAPATLRIEPSAYVAETDLHRVVAALEDLAKTLRAADAARLVHFLLRDGGRRDARVHAPVTSSRPVPSSGGDEQPRVIFLQHFVDESSLAKWDVSLAKLDDAERGDLIAGIQSFLQPLQTRQATVRSRTGQAVAVEFHTVVATSATIERRMRTGDTDMLVHQIRCVLDDGADRGCAVAGLGGYLSIASQNGRKLDTSIPLTTGNAFTVAMGIAGLRRAAADAALDLTTARVGVVGAAGNICSAYVRMIAGEVPRLTLVGRPQSRARLAAVAATVYHDAVERLRRGGPRHGIAAEIAGTEAVRRVLAGGAAGAPPDRLLLYEAVEAEMSCAAPIRIEDDLGGLGDCDVIVSASNSAAPILRPQHVSDRLRIICDISIPPDVSPEVLAARPDLVVLSGGVVRLPYEEDLELTELGLPPGYVLACMAETMLLGLENHDRNFSCGEITPADVAWISAVAEKHGFTLGYVLSSRPF